MISLFLLSIFDPVTYDIISAIYAVTVSVCQVI